MQPIDLVPENFSVISSLITSEQMKFTRAGMLPGFARVKAYEAVAPLIRPDTDGSGLASWVGRQGRLSQMTQQARPSLAHPSEPQWEDEQVWTEDDPKQASKRMLAQSRTSKLVSALSGLQVGQARSTIFGSYTEAHHWQASVCHAVKMLNWQSNGTPSYASETAKLPDGHCKLIVTRLH